MASASRRFKSFTKRSLRTLFEQGQRLGVDILPHHFYSEIPTIRDLRADSAWKAPYSMAGIAGTDLDEQLEHARRWCTPEVIEALKRRSIQQEAAAENGEMGYGTVESDFLFAFVASERPAQIVQIGCGVSTAICRLAADFAGYTPEIICIEPYPTEYLQRLDREGAIQLVREKAQEVDPALIDGLRDDVFFFVDSTHTLGPAGEVTRIILEMLPRLKAGARVHFHDINFPYDYERFVLTRALFFRHESVLLQAFLAFNERFRITASLSMLHYGRPGALKTLLPHYRPAPNDEGLDVEGGEGHFPSATYLEVVA